MANNLFENEYKLKIKLQRYKEDLVVSIRKLMDKIKHKVNDRNNIYSALYATAMHRKMENKRKIFDDTIEEQKSESKVDEDLQKYSPNDRVFAQFDFVKLKNYKDKKIIINNFGNEHDHYCLKSEEISYKNKQKVQKQSQIKNKRKKKNKRKNKDKNKDKDQNKKNFYTKKHKNGKNKNKNRRPRHFH